MVVRTFCCEILPFDCRCLLIGAYRRWLWRLTLWTRSRRRCRRWNSRKRTRLTKPISSSRNSTSRNWSSRRFVVVAFGIEINSRPTFEAILFTGTMHTVCRQRLSSVAYNPITPNLKTQKTWDRCAFIKGVIDRQYFILKIWLVDRQCYRDSNHSSIQ